jgi:D-xylose transport system substrate-binding protein
MSRSRWKGVGAATAAVIGLTLVAVGCGGGGGGGGGGAKIALLLPENQTARYESHDRPDFEAQVKKLCSDCSVLYSNATQDATKQQSQAEAALTQGAKVLVLDAVDAGSAGAIVQKAKAQNVPVLSYDRLITNADIDAYVSFDNERVGKLQGDSLVAKLKSMGKAKGPVIMINGDPADNNAKLFKKGATGVFNSDGVTIAKQYDTPGWLGSKAQDEMQQAITAVGNSGFAGVYGANDDMAGGAIAAMKSAGINPSTRPSTGQDASLAGIQRILIGEQFMTVYKAVTQEAQEAAKVAVPLAQGKSAPTDILKDKVPNGKKDVPSLLLTPVATTKDNINDTIIKDKFWTASQVCTAKYAAACKSAGIS